MATSTKPVTVENIRVLQVGQYGVRVDEKTWFGVNEPLTPSNFVVGEGYKVSVSISKTGKKYVNEILGQEVAQAAAAAPAPTLAATPAAAVPAPTPAQAVKAAVGTHPTRSGFGTPLTDYDLAIQRQISRAGVVQAALMSPAIAQWAVNPDEYLGLVRKLADFGFKYVSE